ncbi:hypothetical protein HDU92_006662 [Lobulomyces angularis]|nr:hypothetical protein HDU92_006662 [Lobulomyces angularis]
MNRIQKKHLKKPHFDFPTHFYDDVEEIIEKLFQHDLSNISNCTSMVKSLQNIFNKEYIDLRKRELTVDFKFENLQKKPEFDIQITEISFIYGPHPIPPNYVVQNWPIHKLIIPQSDKVGKNHQHQEQIFRNAMNEGCCIKIYTRVTFKQNLQFIVKDGAGKILIEDYRNNFDIQFCTPNFKPTDNIYEMTSPKKKHLKFDWKISDIDYLIYGTILESSASDTFNNYT